ncbi:DUF4037 domain-containing protein [bacterium]|nr:DUF4037 domain-containing protein [bacterium]
MLRPATGARRVRGLGISRSYWHEIVAPAIAARFPSVLPRIASGLVGEGSECFGFDDDLSLDHDFDPSPCLWLSGSDFASHGDSLAALLESLPPPARSPLLTPEGRGRRGVHEIGTFYRRFLGLPRAPRALAEWRAAPEAGLAAATNGELFVDPLGEFTSIRDDLLAFYPEDLRLARLARRLHAAGQSGQYNRERSLRRGEAVAASLALAGFVDGALAIAFLLARRFRPFSKWAHHALGALAPPGPALHGLLAELVAAPSAQAAGVIEEIALLLVGELRSQGLTQVRGAFLVDHARPVASRIADPLLRRAVTA